MSLVERLRAFFCGVLSSAGLGLTVFEELIDRKPNVFCYLAKQSGRNIAPLLKGNRCAPSQNCLCDPRCLTSTKPSLCRIETTSAGFRAGMLPTI